MAQRIAYTRRFFYCRPTLFFFAVSIVGPINLVGTGQQSMHHAPCANALLPEQGRMGVLLRVKN
ncbi:MAG: hypothetical protein C7B44_09340 [Sulfobacillus thermosulfidooxidans]|nr:MAG: hypothetical protein C7B44_09340 [Sulfobacillus thermosulfidooxidans]